MSKLPKWIQLFIRVSIVLFIFLILFILIPIILLAKSSFGILEKDVSLAILGYWGAIIGGLLTLFGVWWTITDQDKKRKADLEIQYMPKLDFIFEQEFNRDINVSSSNFFKLNYTTNNQQFQSSDMFSFLLKIKNSGDGSAYDLKIDKFEIINNPSFTVDKLQYSTTLHNGNEINICAIFPPNIKNNSLDNSLITFDIDLSWINQFISIRYEQNLVLTCRFSYDSYHKIYNLSATKSTNNPLKKIIIKKIQ